MTSAAAYEPHDNTVIRTIDARFNIFTSRRAFAMAVPPHVSVWKGESRTQNTNGRDDRAKFSAGSDFCSEDRFLASYDRDGFDLDHPVGMRQRSNFDERRGGTLLSEILLANRREIDAVAHVGHIRCDFHDVRHRAALRFDESLDGFEGSASLAFEIAAATDAAVLLVRNLARQKKDRLSTGNLHALTIRGRIEQPCRAEFFDRRHSRIISRPDVPEPSPAARQTPRAYDGRRRGSRLLRTDRKRRSRGCRQSGRVGRRNGRRAS